MKLPGEVFSTQAFVLLPLAGQGLVTLQTSCLAAAVTAKPAVWAKPWGAAKEDGFCLVTQQADWHNGPCNSWTPSPFFFFFSISRRTSFHKAEVSAAFWRSWGLFLSKSFFSPFPGP